MRTLVLSVIHGNLEALRAVLAAEVVDEVLCLGDLVDYGPRPAEVLDLVRRHARLAVRGNHDTAVALGVPCRSAPAFRALSEASRELTVPMLTEHDRSYLAELPVRATLEVDGLRLEMLHAAPDDPLYHYLPATDVAGWRRALRGLPADLVLVGHTHLPAVLEIEGKLLVNPGSVGLPRDGDPRASYAVLSDGRAELKRVGYDVEATVKALRAWGLAPEVARVLEGIYRRGSLER